jgi:hypothetical protein
MPHLRNGLAQQPRVLAQTRPQARRSGLRCEQTCPGANRQQPPTAPVSCEQPCHQLPRKARKLTRCVEASICRSETESLRRPAWVSADAVLSHPLMFLSRLFLALALFLFLLLFLFLSYSYSFSLALSRSPMVRAWLLTVSWSRASCCIPFRTIICPMSQRLETRSHKCNVEVLDIYLRELTDSLLTSVRRCARAEATSSARSTVPPPGCAESILIADPPLRSQSSHSLASQYTREIGATV